MQENHRKDVLTYGITKHPNDLDRIWMLLNFYQDQNLQTGKEIINSALAERSAGRIYLSNFSDVTFELPDDAEEGEKVRFQRRVLFYRALLSEAGFGKPPQKQAKLKGLFNEGFRKALGSGKGKALLADDGVADRDDPVRLSSLARTAGHFHDRRV
jgi:hypothetical protein